jgi:hypothetical protein
MGAMTPAELLGELEEELSRGRVVEARIRAVGVHVDGLCEHGSQMIYIDPRAAIVTTLLHELIHRRWPSWSERRVYREEQRLLVNMTPEQVSDWYRKYSRAKRIRKRIKDADEE